jgi:hypothetical protein
MTSLHDPYYLTKTLSLNMATFTGSKIRTYLCGEATIQPTSAAIEDRGKISKNKQPTAAPQFHSDMLNPVYPKRCHSLAIEFL